MSRPKLLITGGSSGIGAATARLAAERGYDITLSYLSDAASAEAVAQDVRAAGGAALVVQADMADPAQIAALFEAHDAAFGRLDAFVNNAGIVGPAAPTEAFAPERVAQIITVNVTGAILAAGQAVRRMARRHGGSGGAIVNISSAAARLGSANQYTDYAASKAAIDIFTKGLSDENAADGIRVTAIRPGIIDTPIHGKGGEPDRAERIGPSVPMARKGTAAECAQAILWLMSDEASYVTGTILDVSGGR